MDAVSRHSPPHVGHITPMEAYIRPHDQRLRAPLMMPNGQPAAFSSYVGIAGSPIGMFQVRSNSFVPAPGMLSRSPGPNFGQVTDGLSATLMVGERPPLATGQAGRWYSVYGVGGLFPGPDGCMLIPESSVFAQDPCTPVPLPAEASDQAAWTILATAFISGACIPAAETYSTPTDRPAFSTIPPPPFCRRSPPAAAMRSSTPAIERPIAPHWRAARVSWPVSPRRVTDCCDGVHVTGQLTQAAHRSLIPAASSSLGRRGDADAGARPTGRQRGQHS